VPATLVVPAGAVPVVRAEAVGVRVVTGRAEEDGCEPDPVHARLRAARAAKAVITQRRLSIIPP